MNNTPFAAAEWLYDRSLVFFLRNQRTRNSTKMTKSYDYANKSLLIALTLLSLFIPAMYYHHYFRFLFCHFAALGRVSQRSSK